VHDGLFTLYVVELDVAGPAEGDDLPHSFPRHFGRREVLGFVRCTGSAEPRHESIEPVHVEDDATRQHRLTIALRRSHHPRAIWQALIVLDLAPGTRYHHIVSE
jgi:hypothetical protein